MICLSCASAAGAQKIGFLKKALILESCQAMRDFQMQMDQLRKKSMVELVVEENALRDEEHDLKRVQHQLSPEHLSRRTKLFEKRVHALQKKTDFLKKQFQVAYLHGVNTIQTHMTQVVDTYARQQEYVLILDHPAVLYGRAEDDIGSAVQSLLDQSLPKIEARLPTEKELEESTHGS